MADTQDITNAVIDTAAQTQIQNGLANAINDTFSYASNSLFMGVANTFYRDYMWRYVRPALSWLDGYVYNFHNALSGIISTRIGNSLITGITRSVLGEKLVFKLQDKQVDDATLNFTSKWSDRTKFVPAMFVSVGYMLGAGTAVAKINTTSSGEAWCEAVRLDNCFYRTNFFGDIEDITFLVKSYTDTRPSMGSDKESVNYFLTEHRYIETCKKPEILKLTNGGFEVIHKLGDKIPMVEYKVYRCTGTSYTNTMPNALKAVGLNWQELPNWLKDNLATDYFGVRINEPLQLPFLNIGCELFRNQHQDLGFPNGAFGHSLLINIQTEMITYELACSYQIRDMYLGKGTIYQPKNLTIGDIGNLPNAINNSTIQGYGDEKVELLKGVDPDTQKAIVQQFELRANDWQIIKDDQIRNIATKWNMSPKMLASYLTNESKTATEVDSDDDASLAFIEDTRSCIRPVINRLLETIMNFYGKSANVVCDFATPHLVNKDKQIERVEKLYNDGFIDLEEAIRQLNPDDSERMIQEKIAKATARQNEIKDNNANTLNDFGDFTQNE